MATSRLRLVDNLSRSIASKLQERLAASSFNLLVGTKEPPPPPSSVGGDEEEPGDIGIANMVFLAFMHTQDDRDELAEQLKSYGQMEYEEIIRQELLKLGCSDDGVHLREEGELKWLHDHCLAAASGIVNTYNRDLRKAIQDIVDEWADEHNGSYKGLNRVILAQRVTEWDADHNIDKAITVAMTESAVVDDRAIMMFAEINGTGRTMARVLPEDAVCSVCQSYVDMGWVTLARAAALFSLPVHPNCPHMVVTDIPEHVPCEEMWRGGTLSDLEPEWEQDWETKEANWDESQHPRDETGKFTSGGGSGGSGTRVSKTTEESYRITAIHTGENALTISPKNQKDVLSKVAHDIPDGRYALVVAPDGTVALGLSYNLRHDDLMGLLDPKMHGSN